MPRSAPTSARSSPTSTSSASRSVGTLQVNASPKGTTVFDRFSAISRTGIVTNGNYTTVQVNPIPAGQIGAALGAVDQNLALDAGVSGGNNVIKLYSPSSLSSKGTITLAYPDLLEGLSQSFRTDLGGVALIDIQGDVQSVRGDTANGVFLNDTGNLATIKIQRAVNNSTIVGQPISHIEVPSRTNTTFLTSGPRGRQPQRRDDGAEHPADRPDDVRGRSLTRRASPINPTAPMAPRASVNIGLKPGRHPPVSGPSA